MRKVYTWRWLFFLGGLVVMSLGVTMTIKGQALGTSPWDVLHIGLYKNLGLTIGAWNIIIGILVIGFTSILLKELPKMGTWLNMLLCGFFIDIFNWLLPNTDTLIWEITYFCLGIVVLGFGAGMYIAPNLGAGPRDSLMLWMVDRFGGTIKRTRTGIEVIVAIIGWFLGGPIGIGTVIIALTSGYIIQFALPYFRKLLLKSIGDTNGIKPFF